MNLDVIELTQTLISMPSVTRWSNVPISDFLHTTLEQLGFAVERLEYVDENQERKVNLIAQLGRGSGGLAFCSHSDTVPGQEEDWEPFKAVIKNDRLYGRGSCDMKGPLAATIVAVAGIKPQKLSQPIFIIITADEETGLLGAKHVVAESHMLRNARPQFGVIAEPTQLVPVYSHKGFAKIEVTAYGKAAHSSTGLGLSANFLIAPFLAEMATLAQQLQHDEFFMNNEFTPPSNGFNMVINDGDCALNVTAPKSTCILSFRAMPQSGNQELIDLIIQKTKAHNLDVEYAFAEPLYVSPESRLVQAACKATGETKATTASYGTDGVYLQQVIDDLVVLGPGDIAKAHTVGESIPVGQLQQAVSSYQRLIEMLCLA